MESLSQIGLKKLEELVKRVLTLKVDMQRLFIIHKLLPFHPDKKFTYGIITIRYVK